MGALLFVGSAVPGWAAESMTLTFVRHGESEGNASGTATLDPPLTENGILQAKAVAQTIKDGGYDGIYASALIRTQQTAKPIAAAILHKDEGDVTIGGGSGNDVVALPGLNEIEPGALLLGLPEAVSAVVYLAVGSQWIFGNRYARIPGSVDGNEFDARMDEAVQTIYDSGDRNAVAVSHGAAMMFWVTMNVDNPDPLLIFTHPLDNTSVVVVTGSPEDGWHLQNWNGVEQSAEPSFPSKMLVNTRTLVMKTADSVNAIGTALPTLDAVTIANAIQDGVATVGDAAVEFDEAVARDVIDAVGDVFSAQPAEPSEPTPARLTATASRSNSPTAARGAVNTAGASAVGDGNKVTPGEDFATARIDVRKSLQHSGKWVSKSLRNAGAALNGVVGAGSGTDRAASSPGKISPRLGRSKPARPKTVSAAR